MNKRTQDQLDRMTPEKRARALEVIDRHRDPSYREREIAAREAIDREIAAERAKAAGTDPAAVVDTNVILEGLVASMREHRERSGLSIDDVSARSGIERGALSKLECGHNNNPTIRTLARYAGAIGCRLRVGLEALGAE
jgi:hypothetical protein